MGARFETCSGMQLTILDFTAAWCGPCKTIAPILAALEAEYGHRIRVVPVDVEAEPALAQQFGVRSMPTIVLVHDGREVGRTVGARSRAFYTGMIDRALAGETAIAGP